MKINWRIGLLGLNLATTVGIAACNQPDPVPQTDSGTTAQQQEQTNDSVESLAAQFTVPRNTETVIYGFGFEPGDGDSFMLEREEIRLVNIDAPEALQTCFDGTEEIDCGQRSAQSLGDKLRDQFVFCAAEGTDKDDRYLSTCFIMHRGEQLDINGWLVEHGRAVMFRDSRVYQEQQRHAQQAGLGIWEFEFQNPWDWRAENN